MEFLYPNVFFMMLLPLIVLIILILTNKDNMESYFSKETLDRLSVGDKILGKSTRNGLFLFALVLFIVAMARPVMDKKELDVKQKLIPLVIALDLSKSMKATDIFPDRITLAKKKLKSLINLSKNSTIGVVLFAKDSYILSPVTEDLVSLNYIVDNLDTTVDISNGSNISAVLRATNHMLKDFSVKNLVILSDGGNDNSFTDEQQFAKDNNISVYTIGLATKKGSPIPQGKGYLTDKEGKIVTVKLNESIKELAIKTGGGYIDFTLNDGDVKAIVERINLQSKKEELSSQKMKVYKELFYFPLALGIFVLLLALSSAPSFKRKNITAVFALLFLFFTGQKSYAFEFEFEKIKKAKDHYENGEFDKAGDEYRRITAAPETFYNLGNSLYKQKKYDEAIKTYSKIVTENKELEYKKLHNLGNSYVNKNDLLKAKEFYEKALKIKDDKQTRENLELVNKELEKQKQKNKNDQQNDQDKQDKKEQDKKQDQKNKQKQGQNKDSKNKDSKGQKGQNDRDKKSEKQDSKNEEPKKADKKSKDKKQQQTGTAKGDQQIKPQAISDMEEKKWMEILEKQKTPVYIRKMQSREGNNNDEQPW